MVKPERERVDPGHRLWHYREHAAEDNLDVQASSTYLHPTVDGANVSNRRPPSSP
jgi:chitin synthase